MLKLSDAVVNLEVMSLRTGASVGTATSLIINPNNLQIEGWYVTDRFSKDKLILIATDVRDIVPQGLAINDHEVLSHPSELVRLKSIMDINFKLIGKSVRSQSGKRYGKVSDFAVETSSFLIKKIYATQAIVKNLSGGSLSIDRTQIVEITDSSIIIEDPSEPAGAPAITPTLAS